MCGSVKHRPAGRSAVLLAAALFLAALPLELQLHEHALPTVAVAKVLAKDGGKGSDSGSDDSGSDDSGSDKSGSDNSGSDNSGSDDSGGSSGSGSSGSDDSGSSGQGGGDDASGDDGVGSEKSGSSSGRGKQAGQRSIGEFLGLLKKKGEIARVTRTERGVVVRYTDGWREQVVGGSYQLIDRKDRIVVRRAASKSDLQRLLAAAP